MYDSRRKLTAPAPPFPAVPGSKDAERVFLEEAVAAITGRKEVQRLTGQKWVPVLVTDEGEAIHPGDADPRVPQVVEVLRANGYLPAQEQRDAMEKLKKQVAELAAFGIGARVAKEPRQAEGDKEQHGGRAHQPGMRRSVQFSGQVRHVEGAGHAIEQGHAHQEQQMVVAGDQIEQRRLSDAIAPNDANLFTILDREDDVFIETFWSKRLFGDIDISNHTASSIQEVAHNLPRNFMC